MVNRSCQCKKKTLTKGKKTRKNISGNRNKHTYGRLYSLIVCWFWCHLALENITLFGWLWKAKAFPHFGFNKEGSKFEPLIGVFFVDSRMVFARHLTAFHQQRNEWVKLSIGVSSIMHVGG